ncbi:MAG TPA: hypothetical protein VK832_15930, partial [Burkholderiaceae bacterium]|nr:hypothetical protein [Burkholderiaceae bacterium]
LGFGAWVFADGNRLQGNFGYAAGSVIGNAVIIGLGCYVIVVLKPLADRKLHPALFGIAMSIAACHALFH